MVLEESILQHEGPKATPPIWGIDSRFLAKPVSTPCSPATFLWPCVAQDIDWVLHEAMVSDNAMGGTGDWVAIMGFSQGGKVAASLLLRQQLRAEKLGQDQAGSDFKFAVLVAGRAPLIAMDPQLTDSLALADANELTTGAFAHVTGFFLQRSDDHILRLPTLHVHGKKDPGIANHRRLLTDFCKEGTIRLVVWDGDHRVVIQAADIATVAKEIMVLSKQTGVLL